jgi:hypothetical protein
MRLTLKADGTANWQGLGNKPATRTQAVTPSTAWTSDSRTFTTKRRGVLVSALNLSTDEIAPMSRSPI